MKKILNHCCILLFSSLIFLFIGFLYEPHTARFFYLVSILLFPLVISFLICVILMMLKKIDININTIVSFVLFFIITIMTIFNFANIANGMKYEVKYLFIYGLSFYSVFYANEILKDKISINSFLVSSNPFLLITGPIAYKYRLVLQTKIYSRIKKFIPFIIIGFFFYKVIGSPLFLFIDIIEFTDPINTIIFGIIFEMIIYFNFAGISLMIYGSLGIIGLLVPLNFRQPFSSRNIIEYWQSWHVSLSRCLKSIFYKKSKNLMGIYSAIFIVFISSALWHGYSYNFLIWGIFHASLFSLSLVLLKRKMVLLPFIIGIIGIIIGRVIFGDENIFRLVDRFLFNYDDLIFKHYLAVPINSYISLIIGIIYIFIEFKAYNQREIIKNYKFLRRKNLLLIFVFLSLILIQSSGESYAVYNQR